MNKFSCQLDRSVVKKNWFVSKLVNVGFFTFSSFNWNVVRRRVAHNVTWPKHLRLYCSRRLPHTWLFVWVKLHWVKVATPVVAFVEHAISHLQVQCRLRDHKTCLLLKSIMEAFHPPIPVLDTFLGKDNVNLLCTQQHFIFAVVTCKCRQHLGVVPRFSCILNQKGPRWRYF